MGSCFFFFFLKIFLVMPGLVPGIHVLAATKKEDVDGRDIYGEDALRAFGPAMTALNLSQALSQIQFFTPRPSAR